MAITGHQLRDQVLATPVLYEVELLIRGRKAKTAAEDRARRQNRETRQAKVEVRAASVTLRPPYRPDRKLPPVTVNVVLVREPNPPAGETPVEWILVTTLPIDTLEQVRTIVEYYCVRWCIEILFRTLKSGCRIEHRRFEHIDRVLPVCGAVLDRGVANVVRVPHGSKLSGHRLRGHIRAVGMESGVGGRQSYNNLRRSHRGWPRWCI